MYYANASATTASNGDNTFAFFDDFDGATIDTNKWTVVNTAFQAGGIVTVGSDTVTQADRIYSNNVFSVGSYKMRTRFRTNSMSLNTHWGLADFPDIGDWAFFRTNVGETNQYNLGVKNDGTEGRLGIGSSFGTNYHVWEVVPDNSSLTSFYVDDVLVGQMTSYRPNAQMSAEITGYDVGSYGYSDWILIRKYSSEEPTSSFGAEQNN
jgi:hypothetical protein